MSVLNESSRPLALSRSFNERLNKGIIYFILVVGGMVSIFPFYWMISTSLKESGEIFRNPPTLWPHSLTLDHYTTVLETTGLGFALANSLIVTVLRVLIGVLVALMTGYALAKLRFPGRNVLFVVVLALIMIPGQIYLIPSFLLMDKLHLIDTYAVLILPGAVNSFSIFLMRQAFLSMPDDYIDAARIDGADHLTILFAIGLPMVLPMVLTLALVNAFWSWNDFMWPFIVVVRDEMATLPVALARFARTMVGTAGSSTRYGDVLAAATLTALPIVIVFLFFQRKFVESLTMSGLKG